MKVNIISIKRENYEKFIENDRILIDELMLQTHSQYGLSFNEGTKWIYRGVILDRRKSFCEYHIKDGDTIVFFNSKSRIKPDKSDNTVEESKNENLIEDNTENKEYDILNALVEFGYNIDKSRMALKDANYDFEKAIEILNKNKQSNIEKPIIIHCAEGDDPTYEEKIINFLLEIDLTDINALNNIVSIAKALMDQDNYSYNEFIEMVEEDCSEVYGFIQANLDSFMLLIEMPLTAEDNDLFESIIGADKYKDDKEDDYEFEEIDEEAKSETNQMSNQDKNAIKLIVEVGFSEMEATEAYFACDKNPDQAIDFLFNKMN